MQVNNNCLQLPHARRSAERNAPRVPAGQLELQDGMSADEPDHMNAYRELLVTDNLQELDAGGMWSMRVVSARMSTETIFSSQSPTPPPAAVVGARASSDFFDRFNDPNDHSLQYFIQAERRLIAEWLDVGAQYYNNPFDAPAN